jgi:hypothetical protein
VRTARAAAREGAGGQPWVSHRPSAPRKAAVGERAANTFWKRYRRLARASTLLTAALSASPAHCFLLAAQRRRCPPPSWLSLLLESGHLRRSGRLQSSASLQQSARHPSHRPPPCGSASAAQAAAGVLSRDSVAATILLKRAGRARPPPLLTASLFFLLHACPQRWLSD